MKIIGIDYGTKRIGLAISDETRTFARELAIVAPKDVNKELARLVAEEAVEGFALGYPLSLSGQATEKSKEVDEFKTKLEETFHLPVYLMDERLSSVMAGGLPGGKANVDSLAAQIILQNFLDQNKNKNILS